MTIDTSKLYLLISAATLRNPSNTVARVVNQVVGARYEARPVSELVTQMLY